jgi:hypothetical protein
MCKIPRSHARPLTRNSKTSTWLMSHATKNPRRASSSHKAQKEAAKLAHQEELENLGYRFFKYTQLFEDNACIIRKLPEGMVAPAHARAAERTFQEQQTKPPVHLRTTEQFQLDLQPGVRSHLLPLTSAYSTATCASFGYSFNIYPVAFTS